ncbi:hypothetical protein F2P81_015332 [Scophthalmus maximus]|uniref:Uncharacterized protein n=1 Tax=Scophthalmus maximus TaxID=52904 RepID=A0A6A4SS11_SCOMX|nr:hypothetical protein F2P81_015332 [Scophthalmus maximus]
MCGAAGALAHVVFDLRVSPLLSVSLSMCVQLQRLKRSLSFKTVMRSKSVENFFQRSYSDARLPPDLITDPPPSPPLLPGSPLVGERSPSISPSLSPNPSISSHSPSLSLSPSLPTKPPQAQITHCFQDHVFRKPTNCQHCKHMIVVQPGDRFTGRTSPIDENTSGLRSLNSNCFGLLISRSRSRSYETLRSRKRCQTRDSEQPWRCRN